jgi:hypothetical protein
MGMGLAAGFLIVCEKSFFWGQIEAGNGYVF